MADSTVRLLHETTRAGAATFRDIDDDPAFDPIRDNPEFHKLVEESRPERLYSGRLVGHSEIRKEMQHGGGGSEPSWSRAYSAREHLSRTESLMKLGYRPVAWSATLPSTNKQPVTASIWHRPAVTEQEKDRLAERQARAAVALIRLGRGETVWNRLQHNKDPRLRSFIINWFSLLGGKARTSLPRG